MKIPPKNIAPDDEIIEEDFSSDQSDTLNFRIRQLANLAKAYEKERKNGEKCDNSFKKFSC